MSQILHVESDKEFLEATERYLKYFGYDVEAADSGEKALKSMWENRQDAVLTDAQLSDMTGAELCEEIRKVSLCPVLFISRVKDKNTILRAFQAGGDDYLVKPVDMDQLLARLQVHMRRTGFSGKTRRVYRLKQLILDDSLHRIIHRGVGREVRLSPTEYNILFYMVQNPDILLSYRELYESIWEAESLDDVRTLMVHVSNLRRKIDLNKSGMIIAVRGAGYIFSDV